MNSSAQASRRQWLLLVLALVTVGVPLAGAHEQKNALTDIYYNERTGNLEISHRINLHDAEHTLRKVTRSGADLARSVEAQQAFAEYVADHFELKLGDDSTLELTLVGQELERGYLWVYQESKIPKLMGTAFSIENTILQEVVKDQVNTVNVRFRSQVATFVFGADSGRQVYAGPAEGEKKENGATGK